MSTHDEFGQLLRRVAALTSSSAAPLFVAGDRIGRFEIVRLIGEGGYGRVYQARDTDLGRHVALKVLRLSSADRARFAEEAAIAARLNHPNIVTLYDHGVDNDMPYLVLELLEGKTLRRLLDEGPLVVAQVRDLGIQLARALVHAHAAGVVHRDVKPANVFVRDDGLVKLLDFGVSWAQPSPGDASGTRGYMAPEQTRGEPHDGRADVFAVGIVLYEALTGELPRRPLRLDHVPGDLAPALEHALAALADDRATSQQLLDALSARDRAASADPYRWLEPFGEADAPWFFGRARDVSRLRLLLDSKPFVVLTGPSGAGKTSLVRAGLIPRLREEQWDVVTLHAGERSVDELVARLGGDIDWRTHPGRLGEHLRRTLRGQRMLMFVDQAEQLVHAPARDAFLTALLAAADDIDGPIRVVLAVRDDFLIPLAQNDVLRDRFGRSLLLLGAPDVGQLREALTAPARRVGVELDAELVDTVIGALRDEAAPLPLLQLAASRLWELRDAPARRVPRAALDQLGGMAGLIAHHADAVMRGMSPADRALARTMLLQLITSERIRRRVDRAQLVSRPGAERVLGKLVEGRLVTDGEQIELAHESLITGWSELRDWLDDAQAQLKLRERVATSSAHWAERGRPRELLWRGTPLVDASALVDELAGRDREFVEVSLRSARGRRRIALGGLVAALAIAVLASVAAIRASHATARAREALRAQTILHRAEAADDPAVAALLLTELGDREPAGGAAAAVRVGASPVPLAVLRGHAAAIVATAISHDLRHVATCDPDSCRVWPLDGRGSSRVFPGGHAVSFTHDGTTVVIAARTALIRASLAGTTRTVEHPSRLRVMRMLPDDRVVTGADDGSVRLWDGEHATVIAHHDKRVVSLDRLADGRVVSASLDGTAIIAGPDVAPVVLRHDTAVMSARALADGRILTSTDDDRLHLWSGDGRQSTVIAEQARSEVTPVVLPGPRIAYVDESWRVMIVSLAGERPITTDRGHRGPIIALAAVGDAVVSAGGDGQAIIWYDDRDHVSYRGHRVDVNDVTVSDDGRFMVTGGTDQIARVWQIDVAPAEQPLRGHRELLDAARFTPDGKRLLTVSHDGTAKVWDVERGTVLQTLEVGTPVHCGEWMRDGSIFLASNAGLRIYTGDRLSVDLPVPGQVRCGDISPDGRLAVAAADSGAYLIDVATRQMRRIGEWRPGLRYEHVAFSPDGTWLVGAASFDQVYTWPVDGSRPPVQLGTHTAAGRAYFLPDGEHIVIGDFGGVISVFDRAGHEDTRLARVAGVFARPSHDGTRLAIAYAPEATIQSLQVGGAPTLALTGDITTVMAAEISPDNRRAATGTLSGALKLWWITWPDLLARLRASTTACLTAAQRSELLDETTVVAERRFAACERARGR